MIMRLWIARDGITNDLALYVRKPERNTSTHSFYSTGKVMYLSKSSFPEVTYQNSPKRVKIELI